MTSEEWASAVVPQRLLDAVAGVASDRKLRFLACHYARHVWGLLGTESRAGVVAAERFADGECDREEMESLGDAAAEVAARMLQRDPDSPATRAARLAHAATVPAASTAAFLGTRRFDPVPYTSCAGSRLSPGSREEFDVQTAMIRDLFPNPCESIVFAAEWHTETTVGLARTMYDAREFGNLPILADALRDVGCDLTAVLDHCRGPGPHFRGCWVVDLVLGNE